MTGTTALPADTASTVDPIWTWCGGCLAQDLPAGMARCPRCHAVLIGPAAEELRHCAYERATLVQWQRDTHDRIAALDRRIGALRSAVRHAAAPQVMPAIVPAIVPATAPAVMPSAAQVVAPPTRRSAPSPRTVLTWTGGTLLALAGIAFAIWAWTAVGPAGRFGMLLAATAAAAVVARLVRRRTPVTAESLDLVAVVLLCVDWVVSWSVLPGAVTALVTETDWTMLGLAVAGVAALALAHGTRAVVLPHVGVLLTSTGLVGLAIARLTSSAGLASLPLVAVVVLGCLAAIPVGVGAAARRWWPATLLTSTLMALATWLFSCLLVASTTDTLLAGPAPMDGWALAVASLGLAGVPVLAWRTLRARARAHARTAAYGVAGALGLAVAIVPGLRQAAVAVDGLVAAMPPLTWVLAPTAALTLGALLLVVAGLAATRLPGRGARASRALPTGAEPVAPGDQPSADPSMPVRLGTAGAAGAIAALLVVAGELVAWLASLAPGGWEVPGTAALGTLLLAVPVLLPVAGLTVAPVIHRGREAGLPVHRGREAALAVGAIAVWSPVLLATMALATAMPVTWRAGSVAVVAVLTTGVAAALARWITARAPGIITAGGSALLLASSLVVALSQDPGRWGWAALAVLAATALLAWRMAAGTYLLATSSRRVPVAAATALLLWAEGIVLAGSLDLPVTLVAVAASAVLVWAAAGSWPRLGASGIVAGAAPVALLTAGLPAVAGLPGLTATPALTGTLRALELPASALAGPVLWAAVAGWLLLAGIAAMAGRRPGLWVGTLAGSLARYRTAAAIAAAVIGALVVLTAVAVPGWVPAAAFVAVGGAGWLLLGLAHPATRPVLGGAVLTVIAGTAAVGGTALAVAWAQPLTWGWLVLALVTAVTAGWTALRAAPVVSALTGTVAALAALLVTPLALTAAGVAAGAEPLLVLAGSGVAAALLAVSPWLPVPVATRTAAAGTAAIGLVTAALAAGQPATLGTVLAMAAAALLVASRRPQVREARYAAIVAAVGSSWAFVAAAGATVLEAWTLPAAMGLAVAGLLAAHDPHRPAMRHPSWLTNGPALTVAVLPSAAALLAGLAPTWRLAGVAAVAAVALAWGLGRHEQAPVVLGALGLAAVAVQVLTPVVAATPLWVILAAAGIVLTWIGFTWERRRLQVHHAAESWARFV